MNFDATLRLDVPTSMPGIVGGVRDGLVLGAVEVVHIVAEGHQQPFPKYHLDGVGVCRPVEVPDAGSGAKAHGEVEPKGGPALPGGTCRNSPGVSPPIGGRRSEGRK